VLSCRSSFGLCQGRRVFSIGYNIILCVSDVSIFRFRQQYWRFILFLAHERKPAIIILPLWETAIRLTKFRFTTSLQERNHSKCCLY
jgi:hypothetical protein